MLKDIGSGDKDKALLGVRNTTWDISAAYRWSRLAKENKDEGILWLLCTEDKALKEVAEILVVTGDELEQKKRATFCKYLGDKKGNEIYDKLVDMCKCLDDSSRRVNKDSPTSDLYLIVDELEQELLSELTKQKCKREN